jgi:long-chain fatty acid transport protein
MYGEFDQTGTLGGMFDTPSVNKANDTAYGYHAGVMYEFTPETRMGLSYHSQVVHHLSGTSRFVGELANLFNNGPIVSSRATVNVTLPPYTALSVYSRVQPKVAVMGSVIYTQWSSFQNLIFNDVAGLNPDPSTTIQVSIPEHYRNTWNFSLGADYYVTDQITLRGGLGYDETPVRNKYRHVQLPDNNRYIIALGGHYQATKAIGLDLGWQHLFMQEARINPPPQAAGVQVVTTNGTVNGGADVFGAQLTWDIV